MKKRLVILIILAVLALLALGGAALAQVSDNHDLSWHVLAPGGREGMASGNHLVHGTLGQLAIGPATSRGTAVGSGYWAGIAQAEGGALVHIYHVYLPLLSRDQGP